MTISVSVVRSKTSGKRNGRDKNCGKLEETKTLNIPGRESSEEDVDYKEEKLLYYSEYSAVRARSGDVESKIISTSSWYSDQFNKHERFLKIFTISFKAPPLNLDPKVCKYCYFRNSWGSQTLKLNLGNATNRLLTVSPSNCTHYT